VSRERILFLDVDGVLNHLDCFRNLGQKLDPDCIARLNRLCEATGAKVVLSSAWRRVDGLERRLLDAGALRHRRRRDWRTPYLGISRGAEIAAWLAGKRVARYAIVDDDDDMLPEQRPFFVKTSFRKGGLTEAHAKRLTRILGEA
jgi:hypothetical protein